MKQELCLADNMALEYEGSRIISFSLLVRGGECIEMLGSSSSGKSALPYFFMGRIPLQKGTFWYRGKYFYAGDFFTETADVQCMVGEPALLEGLTVGENLYLFTGVRRDRMLLVNRRQINAQANFLLSRYETGLRAEQPIRALSMEDRRVLELLVAINREVHFLYIDNCFQNFGQSAIRRILRLLLALKQKGVSILFAGEGVARMTGLSDRVLVIRRGRLVRCFYQNDYTTERFLSWMNGSDIQWHRPKQKALPGRTVLEVKGLTCGRSIRNVNFSIGEKEVVGFYDMDNVVNHDLCRAILGEIEPEAGVFYHHGEPFAPGVQSRQWMKQIPSDYLNSSMIPGLSLGENLALPIMQRTRYPLGLLNTRIIHYISHQLDRDEEARKPDVSRTHHTNACLTAADRLRIVYERWLVAKPELLICEAPVNESDGEMFQIHQEYLGRIAANGTAIILVSQNYSELLVLCDRIFVANDKAPES